MSTAITPAGAPNDRRIGTEQPPSQGTRRRPDSDEARHGSDAAKVTISHQAEAASQTMQLARSENIAAAHGSVADIGRASELARSLAQQITEHPIAARSAQARVNPKSALNLLI